MWSAAISVFLIGQAQPPAPPLAGALKELQGAWEVSDAQAPSGVKFVFPEETGLTKKGSRVTVHGNELLFDKKVVATLTLDFSTSRLKLEEQVKFGRRPIMLTLKDGTEVLCAYKIQDGRIEMVHPHTIGRVGRGSFLFLNRPTEK